MAGERGEGSKAPGSGIAAELVAAGFLDAVEVGRGGAGIVYRCYQTSLARSVAIKVLMSDLDQDNRERFLREGLAMGKLSGHPNIEDILQVGVTETNRPYIVMPYHEAGSLAQRLHRVGRIAWPDALRIAVKLCGALETAHRTGTLHRDIKPGNVLVNDYGEPQLSDFGIARIVGGYETATGFFTGTIAFTAPEVLAGNPPTAVSDVYSLGASIYALIAGAAAHERKDGEDLVAHYLRISSTPVPDMRPQGIPADVCATIEKAMSLDPTERHVSAAVFGRELQAAQRHNGLIVDAMVLSEANGQSGQPAETSAISLATAEQTDLSEVESIVLGGPPAPPPGSPVSSPPSSTGPVSPVPGAPLPPIPPGLAPPRGHGLPAPGPDGPTSIIKKPQNRRSLLLGAAAAVVVLVLVAGSIYFVSSRDKSDTAGGGTTSVSQPTTEAQAGWKPITNARVAREAAATTQSDGTIWIFGGLESDGSVSGRHEGYDPAIDSWKGGDDLPVPVQHAMSVTWQGTPVVLGGWRADGANTQIATEKVWRVVNSHWVELPPLLQPRAAGTAAVVGGRLVVTGGVGANGKLLNTTEVFDGATWKLGAEMPTPRKMLGGASDDKVVYAVGGTDGTADLATVEAYDPAADSWASLPALPQPRSDLGVAIADARLVAVGGLSAGQVLKTVSVMDVATKTWAGLPDMSTARHGMAVAVVEKSVYVIGGATGVDNSQVTSTAESLKLAPRKLQPASTWRSLPDAPTPRLMMAWTVLDDKIFVAGGMRHGETLQMVQSYDPQTGAWQTQPPLPVPLHHATATTYRGEMVVIGGSSDELANASNKVYALRGSNWVELPSLTHARAAAAAAVVGDMLVVAGGQNEKQLVAQTEVFDGKSWKDAADLPTPREHLAAVSDGTYVYTVGGRFLSADKNSAAFERFDPSSGQWTRLVDMPTPRGSYGAAFIDGRIVAVGGEEPTQVLGTAEMYDIAEGKWISLTPMPTARHGEVVAAVGNTVYVIGGANRPTHESAVATVEALDFS
ncbi:Serine/threonine protein kinase with Kelch repeats [uncultured Mycobacterium sp.]|uniref:Serine/threonine protein kinase with Kelch repeats n=1 Tax=uncultured Mycobacterium sp. TaxID=171292 RepID=A0A1Y5PAL3_9MYCO|nr:Serine/threonine protein kinase with Kelch repeats [uncultured Mycobacterium sp.]